MPKKGEKKPEAELSQTYAAIRMRKIRETRDLIMKRLIFKRIVFNPNIIISIGRIFVKISQIIAMILLLKN